MSNIPGLSDRIRQVREGRQLTQKEAADDQFIPPSLWSHYECGKREPSIFNLMRICLALECSADYLLGISTEMDSAPNSDLLTDYLMLSLKEREYVRDMIGILLGK